MWVALSTTITDQGNDRTVSKVAGWRGGQIESAQAQGLCKGTHSLCTRSESQNREDGYCLRMLLPSLRPYRVPRSENET